MPSAENKKEGVFYVVATPIGNLADISKRALQVLTDVDLILSEDTRQTQKLFSALGVTSHPALERLDQNTESTKVLKVLEKLQNGESIALVSDAGTPCVSDPGGLLISELLNANIKVTPVVGPCAFIAHRSVSGMGVREFCFRGFFPRSTKEKKEECEKILKMNEVSPMVFYWFESPRRILETLKELKCFFNSAQINIVKEMTKIHEKIFYGPIEKVYLELKNELELNGERGEWSLALCLETPLKTSENSENEHSIYWKEALVLLLNSGVSVSIASKQISQCFTVSKKDVYAHALSLSQKKNEFGG